MNTERMMPNATQDGGGQLMVRPAQREDEAGILSLFAEGLAAGTVPDNESGADLEHLEQAGLAARPPRREWQGTPPP